MGIKEKIISLVPKTQSMQEIYLKIVINFHLPM